MPVSCSYKILMICYVSKTIAFYSLVLSIGLSLLIMDYVWCEHVKMVKLIVFCFFVGWEGDLDFGFIIVSYNA